VTWTSVLSTEIFNRDRMSTCLQWFCSHQQVTTTAIGVWYCTMRKQAWLKLGDISAPDVWIQQYKSWNVASWRHELNKDSFQSMCHVYVFLRVIMHIKRSITVRTRGGGPSIWPCGIFPVFYSCWCTFLLCACIFPYVFPTMRCECRQCASGKPPHARDAQLVYTHISPSCLLTKFQCGPLR